MEAIGHGTREVLIRHRDGGLRAMDLTMTPMHAADGLFVALLHDITHHKQSEDALQRAAMLDPLTKIANRRHFDAFLEKEWQRAIRNAQPLSLVVLDVDHFKLYNDTLGHAAGDLCLQKVAQALQAHALRPTDLAARYGGEEFVLLFAETAPRRGAPGRSDPHHRSKPCSCRTRARRPRLAHGLDRRRDHRADPARPDRAAVRVRRPGHVCGQGGGRNRVETAVAGAAWEAVRNAALVTTAPQFAASFLRRQES
jgi:two-component system cell cycle response regulator